jgi:hypothetical protein
LKMSSGTSSLDNLTMWRRESYDWIGRTPEKVILVSQKVKTNNW